MLGMKGWGSSQSWMAEVIQLVSHRLVLEGLLCLFELLLQLQQRPVLELCRTIQVIVPLCRLNL